MVFQVFHTLLFHSAFDPFHTQASYLPKHFYEDVYTFIYHNDLSDAGLPVFLHAHRQEMMSWKLEAANASNGR
jgi:hypothetical protein